MNEEGRFIVFRCNSCRKISMHILREPSLEKFRHGKMNLVKLRCKYCLKKTVMSEAQKYLITFSHNEAQQEIKKHNTLDYPYFKSFR